jgi:hypothetical protein
VRKVGGREGRESVVKNKLRVGGEGRTSGKDTERGVKGR